MSNSRALRLIDRVTRTGWRTALMIVVALLGTGVLILLLINLRAADVQRQAAFARQSDSYEILVLTQCFGAASASAEAMLSRYVVAGEPGLSQNYATDWDDAGDKLSGLERRLRGNPEQAAHVARLRRAYNARGAELARIADATRLGRDATARNYFSSASNSPHLAALTREASAIFEIERSLLHHHSADARTTARSVSEKTRNLALFGIMLAFVAIALGWLNVRAIHDRARAAAEAEAQRARSAELEAAVAAATAGLQAEARERATAEAQLRQAQKMDAVGQLTGGIAHDFNNMLAVVLGGLELARRNLPADATEALRHLDNAGEGATRAAALTRQLLGFARSEALAPESIEPAELIRDMSALLDRTLGEGIIIETRNQGAGWCVWADRVQIENALLNLAVNARDAMDGHGTLVIASDHVALNDDDAGECVPGDYVRISVSDTGTGMAPEVMERAFEPFFTTKPVGKGTGLGLSQIFGFVRQSGGDVRIESTLGVGTRVTMLLPCHAATRDAPGDADRVATPPEPHRALDILVVEDDPRVLSATVAALEELGHRPVACSDPLAAPGIIDRLDALDLIMSDVLMPGQTGPEMIAELEPRLDGIGVLFVTGYAGEAEEDRFAGRPVLRKPFTLAALEQAIGAAIAPARNGHSTDLAKP